MHNIDCLMDSIAQTITQSTDEGKVLFSTIDLRYAYSQLPVDDDTAKQRNFNIRLDQARCLKGKKIQQLCKRYNLELIYAPANDHRTIGLVDYLVSNRQTKIGQHKTRPQSQTAQY